ncbi:hypothetical protein CONCODRAFT_19830 [Conidiobolus coronatus NRRL 28638]|uniref:RNI-like protein n=1 Tax=Conidiobolus coronatus (strain ATCC 28846 / CBS 209.66 / NRRL 28638) TaxID=796925 RepID=A0A137NWI2_CONC2|nr:hypothetical protein CONCODRAFT_19830 [Conidiobolus coronatus NRRL 28638]|eukprot:KXN67132.1 hypothetical protein CONCODRAFT_19830 [Conidiobolus coronatus NRRL 28638]
MEIVKIDWNKILKYKEITAYLSFTDNIELSTCSSKLRNILYGEKLKPFQLREYLKKEDFRTFEAEVEGQQYMHYNPFKPPSEIVQASVNQFKIELQSLNPTVETLIIYDLYDYLYGLKIADRFVNIASLNFNMCKISREMLQYMLNKLKLTELSIKSTTIIGEDYYGRGVEMPQSLKKIEFSDVKHDYTNIYGGYISFNSKQSISSYKNLKLSAERIGNLKTLYYRARGFRELTKFIELNPQLKSLTLRQYELFPEEISALIKNNQIEHLDSELSINPISENGPHVFENLKSLVTLVGSDTNSTFNIAKSCPNLRRLTTYIFNIQSINNSIYYASQLKKLNYERVKRARTNKL